MRGQSKVATFAFSKPIRGIMNSHQLESQILKAKSNSIQPDHKRILKKYEQLDYCDQKRVTFFLNPEVSFKRSTKGYP